MRYCLVASAVLVASLVTGVSITGAQTIGTFRWQQQPFCNVITVTVVQQGGVYRLDGYDDQCGGATRAAVTGLAFPNPNGTIGFGLTVVTSPGGAPLHIDASIPFPTLTGTWRDNTNQTGAWVFTSGAASSGPARPAPRVTFPNGLSANFSTVSNVANPVAPLDAANRQFVEATVSAARPRSVTLTGYSGAIRDTDGVYPTSNGCMMFPTSGLGEIYLDLPLPPGATPSRVTLHYLDSTPSAYMQVFLIASTLAPAVGETIHANSLSATTGAVHSADMALSGAIMPAGPSRRYYLRVINGVSHAGTGFLNFCGASVQYSLP